MTERCTCHAACRGVDVGIFIDGHEMTGTECRDLINELLDECKELRYANNVYTETIDKLKKSVKRQQSSNNECAKLIKEQQKENQQLKDDNKRLRDCLIEIYIISSRESVE